jgi:Uma2 family endonuclease
MMPASTTMLLTAEQFLRRPQPADGSKEELVRGEIVMSPPPGFLHGSIQFRVGAILDAHVRPRLLGRIVVETGVVTARDPDNVRGPDVSFWSKERLPLDQQPSGYPNAVADLCVEVLSPDDSIAKVRTKVREYLASGVRLVWVVDPESMTVTVHRPGVPEVTYPATDTIDGGDVLPEFRSKVIEFFS